MCVEVRKAKEKKKDNRGVSSDQFYNISILVNVT